MFVDAGEKWMLDSSASTARCGRRNTEKVVQRLGRKLGQVRHVTAAKMGGSDSSTKYKWRLYRHSRIQKPVNELFSPQVPRTWFDVFMYSVDIQPLSIPG